MPYPLPDAADINRLVSRAIEEDVGTGDLTADLIDEHLQASAKLLCREAAVLCGTAWFEAACRMVDEELSVTWHADDGDCLKKDSIVCLMEGRARSILTAERTAINLLQALSGTATVTRSYVQRIEGTRTRILDTRKTIPGMRLAQKYAVAVGGGQNHRIGLYDGILIKENHIAASGSIANAVSRAIASAERQGSQCHLLEIEVESLDQLDEAIAAGATRIMLDNFSLEMMVEAVAINNGAAELEVSGNVGIDEIRSIADTGVDYISIGALTKHVRAVDFSLRIDDSPHQRSDS